ncbi:hypothetical protein BBAL3_1729 [Brevundimonas sp. BAL3]|nr:hypothetical protein BBAL3_1729 [Brevundimonas sp. BAL3]
MRGGDTDAARRARTGGDPDAPELARAKGRADDQNPSTWAQAGLKHRPNPCQREGLSAAFYGAPS